MACPKVTYVPLAHILSGEMISTGIPEFHLSTYKSQSPASTSYPVFEFALTCRSLHNPILMRGVLGPDVVARWAPQRLASATEGMLWKTYAAAGPYMAKGINTWTRHMQLSEYLHSLQQETKCAADSPQGTCGDGPFLYPRFGARFMPDLFHGQLPSLFAELSFGAETLEPIVRMAQEGVQWGAHYDQPHNHMVQLYGSKRVLLFPYSEASALGIQDDRHTATNALTGRLDVLAAQVVLHAGDVLYIPPGTIHFTEATTLNVVVNEFSGFGRKETLEPP